MADPAVIKERLLTRETVPSGRGALERVLQRYKALLDLIRVRNDESEASLEHVTDEQIYQAKEDLRRDVMLHQLEMRKLVLIERANDKDMVNCEGNLKDLGESLSVLREELTELKQKLASEKLIRSRREEYEALSTAANLTTIPRKDTSQKLFKVKKRLEELNKKENEMAIIMDLRQKQFRLLLQSIHDLQAKFSNEEMEETDIDVEMADAQNACSNDDGSEGEIDANMEEGEMS